MQDLFKDIYSYHHHYNQLMAEYFMKNSGKISEKCLHLFSHSINAHQIWNARIFQQKQKKLRSTIHFLPTQTKIKDF